MTAAAATASQGQLVGPGRIVLAACGAFAFAQTLGYYAYLLNDPGNYNGAGAQGDQVAYIELAQQVLQGTWQGAVHYMPGLPAVIALSQLALGDPRLGIAVVQAVIYALMVVYAARLAARVFGGRAGPWAAAAVGLNPAIGYYAAQALTEFLTGTVLLLLVGALHDWSRATSSVGISTTDNPRLAGSRFSREPVLIAARLGLLIGAAAYLRAEYLALAVIVAAILVVLGGRRALTQAGTVVAVTALCLAPWVARYAVTTGTPALYNESPFSNLVLMGTWFRVFDEQTFSQLQQIETAPGPREDAIARAGSVGPRPDLSQRYMEQSRGPYERPLGETLSLALGNIQLNFRQYLVNHFVLAPVLIWAGHTPLRQADAPRLPTVGRYAIWGAELALLALALWQAVRGLWNAEARAMSLGFVGIVVFVTAVHVLIAVDERFTTPALPLVGLFAGARPAQWLPARQFFRVRYATQ